MYSICIGFTAAYGFFHLLAGMPILLFSMPDAPMQSLLIWLYVRYILAGIAFDFSTLSYTALMPAITQNPHQRSLLTSFRITVSALAMLLLALTIFAESDRLTGEREAWIWSAVTVAGTALIALLACAATVHVSAAIGYACLPLL